MKKIPDYATWEKLQHLESLQGIPEQTENFKSEVLRLSKYMEKSRDLTHKRFLCELIDRQTAFYERLKIKAFGPGQGEHYTKVGNHLGRSYFQVGNF